MLQGIGVFLFKKLGGLEYLHCFCTQNVNASRYGNDNNEMTAHDALHQPLLGLSEGHGLRQHRRQVIAIASLMAVTSFLKAFQSWIIGIAYYGAIHDFLDYHIYYRQRYNKPFLRDVLNKKRTLQLLISSKIAPPPCA